MIEYDKNGKVLGDKIMFELWYENINCDTHLKYYWASTSPTNKYHRKYMKEKGI